MMGWFTRGSIRGKLFAGVLLTTTSALVVSGVVMVLYDLSDYNTRLLQDLTTQSRLLALANASALQFDDPKVAQESLATLEARPQILATALYNAKGALFATYRSKENPDESFPALPETDNQHVDGRQIVIFRRIVDHNEILGTIYIKARYQLYDRAWQYAGIVLSVAALALIVSMLFSLWLQARVARPILRITDLARQISERRDYSLRAEKTTDDEIGYLVDAFNELLAQVGQRSAELESTNQQLQQHITERDLAGRALLESERRYRTLVTALTSVVWLADVEGNLIDEQLRWGEYTGQTPAQLRLWGWLEAFHSDDREMLKTAWVQARASMQPLKYEAQLWQAATQTYHYVNIGAVPLYDEGGNLREWIGTADDVDERRRALLEVQRLNAELEQRVGERTAELERANKELEAFSYSVSHDLRTPLRAIDGFSQALLEDYANQLDATGSDYLTRVRAAAQRMGRLIDALLTLARVSRASMSQERVNLSAIAEEIVEELRAAEPARAADVRITSRLSAMSDPYLLRIVLENLLSNAWKYSAKREQALIEFGMRNQDGKPCFFVQDNGAGFDMAYASKLFGAFQRLHDAKEFAGTGVGLATVQRIIHRHGGHIWVDAAVDKGAIFYFTLPLMKEAHA
ncbi:MAG TPA: ATP-binding protein [Spongiibacteraceae bacterium]